MRQQLRGGSNEKLDRILARKAELEVALLAEQLSKPQRRRENLRLAAAGSALLIALTTLGGGIASVGAWYQEQQLNRELRIEERVDKALAQLAAERPAQRIAAVSALRSLWSSNNGRNVRIAVSVANAASVEKDRIAANAILGFFATMPVRSDDEAANAALQALVINQRVEDMTELDGLLASKESIERLLQKGARVSDMSDTDLSAISVRGVNLSGVNFDRSNLSEADFTGAILTGASFLDADIEDTVFVRANLADSKLGFSISERGVVRFSEVVKNIVRDNRSYFPPDFRCADLSRARFVALPVVDLTSDALRSRVGFIRAPDFSGAKLDHADFRNMGATFITPPTNTSDGGLFGLRRAALLGDEAEYAVGFFDGKNGVIKDVEVYRQALEGLREFATRSHSSKALFPKVLEPHLPPPAARGSRATPVDCSSSKITGY